MKKIIQYVTATVLVVFGLITLYLSTSIILDLFGVRAQEGIYVLFVVWANFLCSLMYLVAAYGFITVKKWTTKVLSISVVILISAFIGLLVHIQLGGIYKTETIYALIFRTSITLVFTAISYFTITKTKN